MLQIPLHCQSYIQEVQCFIPFCCTCFFVGEREGTSIMSQLTRMRGLGLWLWQSHCASQVFQFVICRLLAMCYAITNRSKMIWKGASKQVQFDLYHSLSVVDKFGLYPLLANRHLLSLQLPQCKKKMASNISIEMNGNLMNSSQPQFVVFCCFSILQYMLYQSWCDMLQFPYDPMS